MLRVEDWITIKNLKAKNPNLGTREIARLLGVSRNTVKRALKSNSPPEYKRNEKINPDITPFQEYIYEKLVIKNLRGSRVLKEIISKGYKGSGSSFYRYINKLKTKEKRTYQRYETEAGEQAQFDWSPYSVVINGILTKIYVFTFILGYSRYRIYEASLSQNQSSVFEAIESSIQEIGGVTEKLQTDNAKCFVSNPSKSNFQWNTRYLSFLGHYGIKPVRSLPKHPWSKGKVENPFKYLEDHFIKDNQFSSFSEFVSKLKVFQSEVNNRKHTTTNKTPLELFSIERESLLPLASRRYVGIKEESRKATADCLISFQGNRYSIPFLFASTEVWIRVSKGYILEIYSQKNDLIASHFIETSKGKVIIKKEHYKNHRIERGNFKRLESFFLELFPEEGWFVEKLKTQKKINPNYHLTRLIELSKYYPGEEIRKALRLAYKYNTYSYIFIKGYLENYSKLSEEKPVGISINKEYLKHNVRRSLTYYKLKQCEKTKS